MDGGQLPVEVIKAATVAAVESASRVMGVGAFCHDQIIGTMMGDPRLLTDQYKAAINKIVAKANVIAKVFREQCKGQSGLRAFPTYDELMAFGIAKADLDVGTLTNFANITGGQTLGYVSLDTQMARGTVRPDSFTLYQALKKGAAFQVVDYWPYASDTGGGLPGTAFQSYGNVATGTLSTNAGVYNLNNITLKLAVDGRAITMALAAQNSFVDVQGQENINASLNVLTSVDWTCYFGDPTNYPNMFAGLTSTIPAANVFDFQVFSSTYATAEGWTPAQTLFNLIYQATAQIVSATTFGRPTHAFMAPDTMGTLQSQVTNLLNNITNKITDRMTGNPIVVNGDFRGMMTRFGEIAFPQDLFISYRNRPAQAIYNGNGANMTTAAINAPSSVTAAVEVTQAGSAWAAPYVSGTSEYSYAVAAMDSSSNESALTFLLSVSGVAAGGSYQLTITPNGAAQNAFRVYRSGLGYAPVSSGVANPASYRYIGTVTANGASAVTFNDLNAHLPGSEDVFLLDLDDRDDALDFRFLLPLTRIELFAQNLYMPWAVTMIGAIRNKVPKFHGRIINFVPNYTGWSPLAANANAV